MRSRPLSSPFTVRVPASSANLGPGFDCLGLALDRWLCARVTPTGDGEVRAAGDADLLGGSNLVVDAMRATAERLDVGLPGCEVAVTSEIPVARGMGSSASAIVAGIRAAIELAGSEPDAALLTDIGGRMEGHADNVSASVMGGVTASALLGDTYVAVSVAGELPWTPVLFIPASHSMTREARGVLPSAVPIPDAAANIGRAVLLAHALREGRSDLLRDAMGDSLHQPYRSRIFPHLQPVIDAALNAGAHGAALSGAGPTVLAFADPHRAEAVSLAMRDAAAGHGVEGSSEVSAVVPDGARVVRE